ncbi:mitogen-activated protein kinase kinase kinase 5 isoform X2 [Vitis vinifera]|uniref:mitogen-activated protein kinase kinase kinase 5 isoform X2 n=1 Tax=Vitis vinifera TaxID=29760 RepID=UPI00053FA08E|nr:mitogen-activated protein kinase kinase kinase 5 isoform X2 [Vitis vinifera]|eukprot:XP_010664609.1 PREDICTED: mitogen-activated protein kinase kinase kinase YODA isoform X2 [Vitis vinifera]
MDSSQNAFWPHSSSSSPPDSPPQRREIGGFRFGSLGRGLYPKRAGQLTRQRKLRHLDDSELGGLDLRERSYSLPVSPKSTSGLRWPKGSERWSCPPVPQPQPLPQPLPLPELPSHIGRRPGPPDSNLGQRGVRSPVTADGNGTGDRTLYGSRFWSVYARGSTWKNTDHLATKSANSPRGFSQDLNDEACPYNLRVNIPARSAPTSGFSSPALSPQRFSPGERLPSSYAAIQDFQSPGFDRLPGCSSQMSPLKTPHTPDYSPLHSPTVQSPCISPCLSPKSPTGIAFSLYPKLLPGSHVTWPEKNGHVTVHPLPLPPIALMPSELPLPPKALTPSESAISHHTAEKPNVPSMKSQWQKGKLIGRGTFGSVYVATNRETGALCAMKEVDIIPDDPKSSECIKQLEQVDDHFYIYLEYVHPGSINKYVDHFGAMTENVVRNFTRHILSGLAYLHSTKTIHRDIKGANLLVDSFGVVKLADFGLAKFLTGQACDLSLKGSPHWMAPEVMQAVLRKDANPDLAFAVDIWSLGCTIIEMLNGRPPWSEFAAPAAMFKVLHESPPLPETLSSEGKDFLQHCFRRNPAERPSAAMLLDHSFVRSSQDQNVSGFSQAFSGMQLVDKPRSPGDAMKHKIHSMPLSSGTQTMNRNVLRETSHFTLKVLPNLSPLLNHTSHIPMTCSLENRNHCAGLKTRGRDLHPL